MQTVGRVYNPATDVERVSRFLVETYGLKGPHVNWCVFQAISATDSTANRPPIPQQFGH